MLVRHVENVSAYALQKRFREIGKVVLDGKRKGVFNARPVYTVVPSGLLNMAIFQKRNDVITTPIIRNF